MAKKVKSKEFCIKTKLYYINLLLNGIHRLGRKPTFPFILTRIALSVIQKLAFPDASSYCMVFAIIKIKVASTMNNVVTKTGQSGSLNNR